MSKPQPTGSLTHHQKKQQVKRLARRKQIKQKRNTKLKPESNKKDNRVAVF